jgi:glutathionylspermidine synthase
MSAPWRAAAPLTRDVFAAVRRRAIFDCCKWDPQVEDVPTIADVPIVLTPGTWRELSSIAERLAREVLAAERELAGRPDLHAMLGLPRRIARALTLAKPSRSVARLTRFDFHHTNEGWRISEANTDVPGGLNEASGLTALMAPHYPGTLPAGDAAGAYAHAVLGGAGAAHVALVHATAYTDDRQVLTYLARRLAGAGGRASLVSPSHLRWHRGRARLATEWTNGPVDAIVRFFPGEWLPELPGSCGWTHFVSGSATALSNPATALLTQSKRFPLAWTALRTPLPAWSSLLPETRDTRDVKWGNGDWVVKPALGRVGEDIGIPGVTSTVEWTRIAKLVRRHPGHWVAQRRFIPTPLEVNGADVYPCVGVYTIDGVAAGAYGRIASTPLIDGRARDAAVLVEAHRSESGDSPWPRPGLKPTPEA